MHGATGNDLETLVVDSADALLIVKRLLSVTEATFERRAQLEQALQSRLVIEQAKGVLAERHGLEIEAAFDVLRKGARSSRRRIHELAREVVASRDTPEAVVAQLREAAAPDGRAH